MKTLNIAKKGVIIGGVAAAILFGGTFAGIGGVSAYAAATKVDYKAIVERNLSGVVSYVGAIANREDSEVREELMRGQNLIQLSGLTGSELLNRLTASLNQSIDLAAKSDKAMAKEELERIKSDASQRISTIISTNGYDDTKRDVDYVIIIDRHMSGLVGYVGAIANREDSEVRELLQQGKNLVELSGLTYSELLKQLTASLNQSIDLAARSDKSFAKEKLDRIKSDASQRISTIITTGGYDDTKRDVDYEIIVDRHISGLVSYVGAIANREDSKVRELLQEGKSLVELSGLAESELSKRLTASLNQSIDLAAKSDKSFTKEKVDQIKNVAAQRISTIISTSGYDDTKRDVDYNIIIDRHMSGLISYVGAIANREDSEVKDLLQGGKSLVELSGLNQSELYGRLVDWLNQSIDLAAKSDKAFTKEKLDRIKSDAAKRIATIISTGGYEA
jgi:predicted dinucleotide-utilizing enzyme